MASSATFNYSYVYSSQQVGKPECVANQINELAPWETPLLSLIGLDSLGSILRKPLDNEAYTWQDMEWTPTRTTLASAITSTTASAIKVSDAIFKPGEEIVIDYETITLDMLGALSA